MADSDRRLVDLYDQDNPDGPDHDFCRALVDEMEARSIIDPGCGTGILTMTTLTGPKRNVLGIDPSVTMLEHARHHPRADSVTWVLGGRARRSERRTRPRYGPVTAAGPTVP